MLAALDREGRTLEQQLVAGLDAQAFRDDDVAAGAGRLQELEPERAPAVIRREHAALLDPLDLLEPRLRLLRLRRLVPEPLDEALEPRELLGLTFGGLRLVQVARGLLAPPHVPGAGEVDRLAALELEHGGRHRFEEPAVVCDEDDRRIERAQHLFQPFERLDVEVVRRLVEEQQVGLRRERARERGARQLAAGEGRERTVEVAFGESEPADDGRGAVAPVVAAGVLEPRLRLGVATEGRVVVSARRHRPLERAELFLDRGQVGCAREDVVTERPV